MELSAPDIRACKLRFTGTFSDGKQLVHKLPNGLMVFTLVPSYAAGKSSIKISCPDIGCEFEKDLGFLEVDGEILTLPVSGKIIDINTNIENCIETFSKGPTTSFTVIVKPNGGTKLVLNDPYVRIC